VGPIIGKRWKFSPLRNWSYCGNFFLMLTGLPARTHCGDFLELSTLRGNVPIYKPGNVPKVVEV
jgi:hypothetical protein